jgi:uncharacterized membrane protein
MTILTVATMPSASRADTWQICNASADEVKVAIAYNLKDQRQYITNGWWALAAHGGCANVLTGNLPIKGVFLRGEAPHASFEGDTLFCVLTHGELPDANKLDEKACATRGGTMRRFEMHTLSKEHFTTTLNGPGAQVPAHRPAGFGNDAMSCPANAPCFHAVYQNGRNVTFEFNVVRNWDVYNVRLPDGEQFENKSGQFTLHDVKPQHTYEISVQGCNKHLLGHSDCSAWVAQKFTAN